MGMRHNRWDYLSVREQLQRLPDLIHKHRHSLNMDLMNALLVRVTELQKEDVRLEREARAILDKLHEPPQLELPFCCDQHIGV